SLGLETRPPVETPAPVEMLAPARPRVTELMTALVHTIAPETSLAEAWRLMRRKRIRHAPVVDARQRLVGLVTHRDLLSAAPSATAQPEEAARLLPLEWLAAREVMETHIPVATPEEPAADAGQRMLAAKIGCLPVVNDTGRLVGIVTEEDFLRWATGQMAPPGASSAA